MKKFLMVSLALTLLFCHTAVAVSRHRCAKTFTVKMAQRAARAAYAGTRTVTRHDLRQLAKFLGCQRNPNAKSFVRWYYAHERGQWMQRKRTVYAEYHPSMSYATASWYDDGGQTASGWHAYYGVAVCGSDGPCVPFGTHILFCYHGCVTAIADDHGPYVAGRAFDLNQNTAAAIGFDGVDTVGYHIY